MSETGIDLASLAPAEIPMDSPGQEPAPAEPETPPAEPGATEVREQEPGQEPEPQQVSPPRDINKRVADYLRSLKDEKNADIVKALRDSYFTLNKYREIYPSTDDALSLKQKMDGFGGVEAISEMQDIVSSVEHTDALLDAGDPEVIDQIFEDSKEGAIKLAPHYLARVQRESPEAYQRAVLPHFVSAIENSGLPNALENLEAAVGDNQQAKGIVRQVLRWLDEQKQLANGYRTDTTSPDRTRISEERQALNQERQQIFIEGLQHDVVASINQSLSKGFSEYRAAILAMPERARQDFSKAAYQEIAALVEADREFKAALDGMIGARKRDRTSVVNFISSKVNSVADRIVSKLANEYGLRKGNGRQARPGEKSNAPANGGSKGSPSAPVKLSGKPAVDSIDWDKTGDEAQKMGVTANVLFLNRKAWLKNGNFVTW